MTTIRGGDNFAMSSLQHATTLYEESEKIACQFFVVARTRFICSKKYKQCEQDNKADKNSTYTVALNNYSLLHIKNSWKSTLVIDLLKADKLVEFTTSRRLFHTLMTLQAKKWLQHYYYISTHSLLNS